MRVIRHEAEGMNLPTSLGARLAQRVEELLAILVIPEKLLAPVATVHYVVNRTGVI